MTPKQHTCIEKLRVKITKVIVSSVFIDQLGSQLARNNFSNLDTYTCTVREVYHKYTQLLTASLQSPVRLVSMQPVNMTFIILINQVCLLYRKCYMYVHKYFGCVILRLINWLWYSIAIDYTMVHCSIAQQEKNSDRQT